MSQFRMLISKKWNMLLLLVIAAIFLYSANAVAADCGYYNGTKFVEIFTQLPSNLTVGPETPDGSILFTYKFNNTINIDIRCNTGRDGLVVEGYQYGNIASMPPSKWHTGPYADAIFETGVPGIGYFVKVNGTTMPRSIVKNVYGSQITVQNPTLDIEYNLIKTGPIKPGVLNPRSISDTLWYFRLPWDSGIKYIAAVGFKGNALNIVSQTCQTPDVNVALGSVNENIFRQVGTTSEWVDASIRLTNCPQFHGTSTSSGQGVVSLAPNSVGLKITPNTPIIDSSKGIFAIRAGADSASGIGVQMAHGKVDDAAPNPVTFSTEKSFNMPDDGSPTQTLPLVARYIQTDNLVKPGKANATATFTINYY